MNDHTTGPVPPPAEEVLWTIALRDVRWRAELRPESTAWAVLIFRESERVYTQQFGVRKLAVEWAKRERERMQTKYGSE